MATETPVDHVEEARARAVLRGMVFNNDFPVPFADACDKYRAAILASDPRVQALEAVARASARMAEEFEFEFRTDPSRMAVVEALAALQEETGEDGAIQG